LKTCITESTVSFVTSSEDKPKTELFPHVMEKSLFCFVGVSDFENIENDITKYFQHGNLA